MTLQLYVFCFVAGVLGIIFHLLAVKLPSLKERATAANLKFDAVTALKEDWIGIASSVVAVLVACLVVDEGLKLRPAIMEYIKFVFVFIGFTGSSILLSVLGRASKNINSVIDVKTNIADGK